jgi:hypothetical protein
MPITSQITDNLLDAYEKRLDGFQEEHKALMKAHNEDRVHASALKLTDIKDEFIALYTKLSVAEPHYHDLLSCAKEERKMAEYEVETRERKSGESVKNSELKSFLQTAEQRLIERRCELMYKSLRNTMFVCKERIDAIIQKISIIKYEEFSSRNTEAA